MRGLIYVGHRCSDHSPSSGYDQVCSLFPESGWLDGRAFEDGEMLWIRKPKQLKDMPRVFHVIYGDCSGKRLPPLLRERFPSVPILSTVHKPVRQVIQEDGVRDAISSSNALLTVSDLQARDLTELGVGARVYAIPHGVWTDVFRASSQPTSDGDKKLLIVGSVLRDWECARRVSEIVGEAGYRSIALGASTQEKLGGVASIYLPGRVSEKELAVLYHESAALLLPCAEATASNALLEAMAAGCPVICPRLPSLVDEYLGDGLDAFEPGQYDDAADMITRYCEDPLARSARSELLTSRSKRFDWRNLKSRFELVYTELCEQVVVP